MGKRKRFGQCYLCRTVTTVTDDHIPPKGLAPKAPRSSFAFAPACEACNHGYSHEESKFRDFVTTAGVASRGQEVLGAFEAMKRNFDRNQLPGVMPNKDLLRIVNSMKQQDIYSESGRVYLGTSAVIYPPPDLDYKRVLVKIAKGLHYVQTGAPLEEFFEATASLVFRLQPVDRKLLANLQVSDSSGDFFRYGGVVGAGFIVWYLQFYRTVLARVLFTDQRPECEPEGAASNGQAQDSGQPL